MSRLVNVANINYVIYKEHEEEPWVTYKPPKKYKYFKIFNVDECWVLPPWARDKRYYTRNEILEEYPDYMLDSNNILVRKDPILYIYMTNGDKLTVKDNAKHLYEYISKLNGKGIISI